MEDNTVEQITITRMSASGARYPLLTFARKVPGVVTTINNSDVIKNFKNIFQIRAADQPVSPRTLPTARLTANIWMESNTFHARITSNLDITICDLDTGFASRSLMVLSVNSRPNTQARQQ